MRSTTPVPAYEPEPQQLAEVREVTRRLAVRLRIRPTEAGHMVNSIRSLSTMVGSLPTVHVAPDPNDDYLLALSSAGQADFLVTGDRRDLLGLERFERTAIVTARSLLQTLHGGRE